MNDCAWTFPALDAASRAYRAAEDTLRARTGRIFMPRSTKRGIHVSADEVLRHHPDLCEALNVRPCADGCNRAAVRYYGKAWRCETHAREHGATF